MSWYNKGIPLKFPQNCSFTQFSKMDNCAGRQFFMVSPTYGLTVCYEEGLEDGLERGREDIMRNPLVKGIPIELICDITGLEIETIRNHSV